MVTQLPNVPKLNVGGTYYAGSGTYVSPSGQGFSTREIPKGATVTFEKNLELERLKKELEQPKIDTSRLNILLPDIKKVETYDVRSGTYISESPTGLQGTAYMRQPTMEEKRRIGEIKKRDITPSKVIDIIERKVTTPIFEYEPIKKVSKVIRDIPVVGGYGSPKITFGESLLATKEGVEDVAEYSSGGFMSTGELFFSAAEGKGKIKKNILESTGYLFKGAGYITKTAPTIIQYSALTPIGGAAVDILATEEKLEKEYGKELREEVKKGIRQERVMPFLFATTYGAFKGYKFLKTPRVVKSSIKGGETISLEYKEPQVIKATDEGIKSFSKYKLMDIKTTQSAYIQSPFEKLIGAKPKLVVLSRGQTYIREPVLNILGKSVEVGKPYLIRSGRVGKGGDIVNQRFSVISGTEKPLAFKDISKLSKTEQYIFKSLRDKDGVLLFSEKEKLGRGIVKELELGKLGTGKATTTYQTGSIVRTIKEFEGGAGIFKVETGFKDVSKPFSRAAGKVGVQKGIIIRSPIIYKDTGTGVEVFMGGGKKSSKKFLEQLSKLETPKPIVKPKPIKVPKPSKTPTLVVDTTTSTIPTYVGGAAISSQDVFTGTGQYEVTEGGQTFLPSIISDSRMDLGTSNIQIDFLKTNVRIKQPTIDILKSRTRQVSILSPQLKTEQVTKQITKLKQRPLQKEVQVLKVSQVLKQQTKQIMRTAQKTTIKKQTTKIKTPKVPIPIIPFSFGKKEKEKKTKLEEDLWEVFVKKRGKDISIGGFETLETAKGKLFKTIRQEIRASGFIKKGKEKIKLELGGTEFVRGKRDSFRIVEPKQRRIKKGTSEVFQIQTAKKIKRKGGFFK